MSFTLSSSLASLGATANNNEKVDAFEVDIPFIIPGSSDFLAKTHAWVYNPNSTATPLVVLHGGPGFPSNYLTPLIDLAEWMPLIIYDQLGCGRSTHFPHKNGDTSFWTEDLFIAELHNLLRVLRINERYSILGHSWGGMLGARFASDQPVGLQKLVITSSPISISLWLEAANRLRKQLPKGQQDALDKHEAANTTSDPEYTAAVQFFYDRHLLRVLPNPDDVKAAFAGLEHDPTVYMTVNGPSEFHVTGPLKNWSGIAFAPNIIVPTLVTNGRFDEGQDSCISPWKDLIPNSEWITFENSSHMAFWEEREAYMTAVRRFLY
ncbi:proline-specific peptidase [Auriculariales sp. MPI-PUGE-AT-0066]|nr:proline-specific peptidase [Auriculariales sp. MPI-PUGE-AT-0066]